MGSSLGCRYWSLVQVVVVVVCCQEIASSANVAQDCVGSQLMLNCPEMKVIQITAVALGDSECLNKLFLSCCISDSDCTVDPNEDHRRDVHRKCDNERSCTVDVLKERIDCGRLGNWSNNDFERITYDCREDPRNKTMNSTENWSTAADYDDDQGPHIESTVSSYVEHTAEQDNSSILTSPGTTFTFYNTTKTEDQAHPRPTTPESSSQVAQGCVGSQLLLNCSEMKVIQITAVVLGDSVCSGSSCCIKNSDCAHYANVNHRTDVHRSCDNKRSCTVAVVKEKVDCGVLGSLLSENDFERITYNCRVSPRIDAGSETQNSSSQVMPVVVGIIGLIILIAVVALVAVVMHRRKKSALRKLSPTEPLSKIDNHQNETDVYANDNQGTRQYKINYAMILKVDEVDEADFPKTGQDPVVYAEVEQRTTISNGQSQTSDQNRTANRIQMEESDAYEEVGEPSKSVSSVFKTDQIEARGVGNLGNLHSDNIYDLTSHDLENIYVNESETEPSTHLVADDVLNISMPQDDDGQTVIENDLYSH